MKIVGKEHDYYDSALAYCGEPNTYWQRKFFVVKDDCNLHSELKNLFEKFKDTTMNRYSNYRYRGFLKSGLALVAGEIYPFMIVQQQESPFDCLNESFHFSLDSIVAYCDKYKIDLTENSKYYVSPKTIIKSYFDRFKEQDKYSRAVNDIHIAINSPIIIKLNSKFYIDGPLKEIEFFKVLDPFTCYQKIEMFYDNILSPQMSNKTVDTEDKYKIESAGFDRKISFRHRK